MTSAALLLSLPASLATASSLAAKPEPAISVRDITVEPASALTITKCEVAGLAAGAAARVRCSLLPQSPPPDGRVRLTVTIPRKGEGSASAPPMRMSVHLFIAEPAQSLVSKHGKHGAQRAWVASGTDDPWHRDGAFFGWDANADLPVTQVRRSPHISPDLPHISPILHPDLAVTQERRVYMSGLSDEAGAGAGLAMAVKQVGAPDADEISKLEEYVNSTLYQGGHADRGQFIQSSADHSVRLSQLYWTDQMNDASSAVGRAVTAAAPGLARVCRSCWPKSCSWMDCWSESHSLETWRAYNYPHVTSVYWSLYRVARWASPPLTKRADWTWYLTRAHRTAMALWTHGGDPWRASARSRPLLTPSTTCSSTTCSHLLQPAHTFTRTPIASRHRTSPQARTLMVAAVRTGAGLGRPSGE